MDSWWDLALTTSTTLYAQKQELRECNKNRAVFIPNSFEPSCFSTEKLDKTSSEDEI